MSRQRIPMPHRDYTIGSTIRFRSATRWSYKAVNRKVIGFDGDRPLVRFGGWSDFVVLPEEVLAVVAQTGAA